MVEVEERVRCTCRVSETERVLGHGPPTPRPPNKAWTTWGIRFLSLANSELQRHTGATRTRAQADIVAVAIDESAGRRRGRMHSCRRPLDETEQKRSRDGTMASVALRYSEHVPTRPERPAGLASATWRRSVP